MSDKGKTNRFELLGAIYAQVNRYRLVDPRGALTVRLHPKDAKLLGEATLRGLGHAWEATKHAKRGKPTVEPTGRVHA